MTEERFEKTMEHFGDAVEKTVEGAAKVFDTSMNKAWGFRPVRFVGKTLTFLSGAGLMISSVPLEEKGYPKTAKFCLIAGGVIIVAQVAEIIIFRKK